MDLHPVDLVASYTSRNRHGLSRLHGVFADVVPQVFAELETRHPDGQIHGGVFSANVRDAFLVEIERGTRLAGLTAVERPFRSVRLYDGAGTPCRMHMHPRSLKSGQYVPTTPVVETLFGPVFELEKYELAILWKASPKLKALKSISLAAVTNLADRSKTTIYASSALPPVKMSGYWQPSVTDQYSDTVDDFEDYLGEDESFGDDPA